MFVKYYIFFLSMCSCVFAGDHQVRPLASSSQLTRTIEQSLNNSTQTKISDLHTSKKLHEIVLYEENFEGIKTVNVKSITVTGSTLFSSHELEKMFSDMIQKTVSLQQIQARMQLLTKKYSAEGYLMTQVWVSEEDLKSGNLHFIIYEAHISDVILQGETSAIEGILSEFAQRLKSEKFIRKEVLQRELLLLNQLPGVSVQSQLKPTSARSGDIKLFVTVTQKRFEPNFILDNNTPDYLGNYQAYAGGTMNSAISEGDSLSVLAGGNPHYIRYAMGQYKYRINSEGTYLDLLASGSESKPGKYLSLFHLKDINQNFVVGVSHPLVLAFDEQWSVRASFGTQTAKESSSSVRITEDKISSLRLGTSYNFIDSLSSVNILSAEYSQGLKVLGAKAYALQYKPTGKVDYGKIKASVGRIQSLPKHFSIYLASEGQYAFTPLLIEEKYAAGGSRFGRGYDSAELLGDHALAGLAELRYDWNILMEHLRTLQFYTFYDVTKVWNKKDINPHRGMSLASMGGGIRINFTAKSFLELEIDKPLTRPVLNEENSGKNGKAPRYFFRYAYKM